MNKLVRDGKVAVIVANCYGVGYSTYKNEYAIDCTDGMVAAIVEQLQSLNFALENARTDFCEKYYASHNILDGSTPDACTDPNYPAEPQEIAALSDCIKRLAELKIGKPFYGKTASLELSWVPEGTLFQVRSDDGIEYVVCFDPTKWIKA
jgi:hypothetical protein